MTTTVTHVPRPRPPAEAAPPVRKVRKERLHFWPYAAAVGLLAALGAGIVIGIDVGNDQVVHVPSATHMAVKGAMAFESGHTARQTGASTAAYSLSQAVQDTKAFESGHTARQTGANAAAQLWGFVPQTSCMPSAGNRSTRMHLRRTPS